MEVVLNASEQPKKGGRPSHKDKPFGKADSTRIVRKLAPAADEAIDLIIKQMRDEEESMVARVKAGQWIVATLTSTMKEVDRQTMMKYTLEKLKQETGGKDIPDDDGNETSGAVFSLKIVGDNE